MAPRKNQEAEQTNIVTAVSMGAVVCLTGGLLTGCQVGAFSKVQSYSNRYIATLERNYGEILTAIADTGKQMGRTAAVNGIARSVTLNSSTLTLSVHGIVPFPSQLRVFGQIA